ncbi:MAG: ECF RNA polymerase sigma factor RpoE [Pseudomonadales bacterium]|nr:ECF RNA polymerase sigma factor RpoE [Pseudomonadales bacterium]
MRALNVVPFPAERGLHRTGKSRSWQPMSISVATSESTADAWTMRLEAVGRERDRQAYAEIFRHFAPLLKCFALSSPGMSSNALAEELVQEVMLKIWNRACTFDASKASATTWIYTLARNCRIDLLRKKHRVREEVDVDELWDLGTEDDLLESEVQQQRAEVDVRESLEALPAEQRQIINKVYMEGKSHTEVAEELGLPLGTVKSRVRLAMSKLKLMLDR